MRKFILFLIILRWSQSKAQVGIGTSTPNSATILDISSTDKGILIPRLTETERNTSLSDNDVNTVPPAGVVNTNLMAGTLIFNTTQNRFEFWDGTLWRQLFVATNSAAGNDGVVRIDGGADGVHPTVDDFGNPKPLVYTTPLTFAPLLQQVGLKQYQILYIQISIQIMESLERIQFLDKYTYGD